MYKKKQQWKNNDGFKPDLQQVADEAWEKLEETIAWPGEGQFEEALWSRGVQAEVSPGKSGWWYTFRRRK